MAMEGLSKLLRTREFVSFATADLSGQPNAAPKLLLKYEKPFVYLIDYSVAKTVENLRVNPKAALSLMDLENLEGYRMIGTAELIEKGEEFQRFSKELEKKLLQLSATRVIEGSRTGKKYAHYELEISDKFVVVKFKIVEATKIGTQGNLYRESGHEIS
jgi:hypothetical protein